MEPTGYPVYILFVVLGLGVYLTLLRPFWAFLLAILLFSSVDLYPAVMTRTQALGPYFNLYDALFCVAIISFFVDPKARPVALPKPVFWIAVILLMGIIQTALYYQVNYFVLRAIRWSITFPMAFFISANVVNDSGQAKLFFYTIILGSILGSLQSFFQYQDLAVMTQKETMMRLSTAGSPLGTILLVAALQEKFFPNRGLLFKICWIGALILFSMCVLFGQWRSIYIAIFITTLSLPFLVQRWQNYWRSVVTILLGLPLLIVFFQYALPGIDPVRSVHRLKGVTKYLDKKKGTPPEDKSRWLQIQRDVEEWSQGNWLIGRGLSFNAFLRDGFDKDIAWGHVGYSGYLSHLGLLGLFVFAVYLPLQILRPGKWLFAQSSHKEVSLLGLLAVTAVVMESVLSAMSSSYLGPSTHSLGFLYGTVWALAYKKSQAANFLFITMRPRPSGASPQRVIHNRHA